MSKQKIAPKQGSDYILSTFFSESLKGTKAYQLEMVPDVDVKLDQNECPWDWNEGLKRRVLEKVLKKEWNRYPDPFAHNLSEILAASLGLRAENILLGPGSNHLISLIFDAVGHALEGDVIIARPSFALFEEQCRYSDIDYKVWLLSDSLDYDLSLMPDIPKGSLVVFASPNNPTGSYLSLEDFEKLLAEHPDSLFFADQAYAEFCADDYLGLLEKYSNLVILRTFSKSMGSAGVRLGYLAGPANIVQEIGKRRLPYMLNHFSVAAAETLLLDPEAMAEINKNIEITISERKRLFDALTASDEFQVKTSETNFLLVKWPSQNQCEDAHKRLVERGVLVRNVSKGPGLTGCLRVSVGTPDENTKLIDALIH